MKIIKALIFFIPLFVLGFILFYNPTDNANKRYVEFKSVLKNDEFEKETKEDIKKLETKNLQEGEGAEVKHGDNILVNYRGWLAKDATVFDESFARGDGGFSFTVGSGVIEGWSEGVIGMKQGEIRRLYVPSELAYGSEGSGSIIGPDEDLIFDVELIRINN